MNLDNAEMQILELKNNIKSDSWVGKCNTFHCKTTIAVIWFCNFVIYWCDFWWYHRYNGNKETRYVQYRNTPG